MFYLGVKLGLSLQWPEYRCQVARTTASYSGASNFYFLLGVADIHKIFSDMQFNKLMDR